MSEVTEKAIAIFGDLFSEKRHSCRFALANVILT